MATKWQNCLTFSNPYRSPSYYYFKYIYKLWSVKSLKLYVGISMWQLVIKYHMWNCQHLYIDVCPFWHHINISDHMATKRQNWLTFSNPYKSHNYSDFKYIYKLWSVKSLNLYVGISMWHFVIKYHMWNCQHLNIDVCPFWHHINTSVHMATKRQNCPPFSNPYRSPSYYYFKGNWGKYFLH